MVQPRFPPRGTQAWYEFMEQRSLVERVDNERQWSLLRQVTGMISGLDPVPTVGETGIVFPTTTTTTTTPEPPPTTTTTTPAPTTTTTPEPTTTTTTTATTPDCHYSHANCLEINLPAVKCDGSTVLAAQAIVLSPTTLDCEWEGAGGQLQVDGSQATLFFSVAHSTACNAFGNIYGEWHTDDFATWDFVSAMPSTVTWDGDVSVTEIACP